MGLFVVFGRAPTGRAVRSSPAALRDGGASASIPRATPAPPPHILLSCWLFLAFAASAQPLTIGGKGGDEVYRFAGKGESLWALGSFQQSLLLPPDSLKAGAGTDLFFTNYQIIDNQIIIKKTNQLGSTANDLLYDAATDAQGNWTVAVAYHRDLWYNAKRVAESANPAVWIASFDVQGQLRWSQSWGGKGKVEIADIQADATGAWYFTGYFQDTLPLGDRRLVCPEGQNAVLVVKLDARGKLAWTAQSHWSAGKPLQGSALAVSATGETYVAGHYAGRLAIKAGDTLYSNPIYSDLFLAKLSPKGQWQWAKRFGGVYADYARQLALDGQRLYLGGELTGVLDLDSLRLMTARRYPDVFVAELDTAGRARRAWQSLGDGDVALETLVLRDSALWLGGYFRADFQVQDTLLQAVGGTDFFWLELDKNRFIVTDKYASGGKGNDLLRCLWWDPKQRWMLGGGSFQQTWQGKTAQGFSDGIIFTGLPKFRLRKS